MVHVMPSLAVNVILSLVLRFRANHHQGNKSEVGCEACWRLIHAVDMLNSVLVSIVQVAFDTS